MKNNSKAIIVKELNNTVYGEFKSIVETAEALNCSTKNYTENVEKSLVNCWKDVELLIIINNTIINIIVVVLQVTSFMQFVERNKT